MLVTQKSIIWKMYCLGETTIDILVKIFQLARAIPQWQLVECGRGLWCTESADCWSSICRYCVSVLRRRTAPAPGNIIYCNLWLLGNRGKCVWSTALYPGLHQKARYTGIGSRGMQGSDTQLFMWGILICISPLEKSNT